MIGIASGCLSYAGVDRMKMEKQRIYILYFPNKKEREKEMN